jgi:UPF0271 protein
MKYTIDINADLGEGMGQDAALMKYISSCSIACGGHFGTDETMRQTVKLAMKNNVKVGAHPSFPDKDNFGRKPLTIPKGELSEAIYFQLLHFYAVCETEEATVNHIKLHGALYNYAAADAATSDAVVEAIIATNVRPKLYVPYDSVLHHKAKHLVPLEFEAFIDRRYTRDGKLLSRTEAGALIETPDQAWEQLQLMLTEKAVITATGEKIPITASTFCIHGDHTNALQIAAYIHSKLKQHHISFV